MKYSFYNDYSEGAHPSILDLFVKYNFQQETGYGEDTLCEQAKQLIQKEIAQPDAAIHFVSSGSQANIITLGAMVKPYQSVIAPVTGHVNVHETGALEATGHKINQIPTANGKITPEQIQIVVDQHQDEHMVEPAVVYISQSTEVGTIYSKQELTAISDVCRKNHLYLYIDGARLGSALTSSAADLDLPTLTKLVDAFYIGGTKNGALIGEAIVLVNPELHYNFRRHMKHYSALLAKGRVLGTQFLGLFTNNLYFDLAKHANLMAAQLKEGIRKLGYDFLTESPTNQIFPIFPNTVIEEIKRDYGFYMWTKIDEQQSAIRLVTSWATSENNVTEFLADLATVPAPE